MNRRTALAFLAFCPWARAFAQDTRNLPKIGVLWFQDAQGAQQYHQTLREALEGLGHVDGKTVTFVTRYADGNSDRLAVLVKEMLAQKLAVLYLTPRALAMAKTVSTLPPIISIYFDPVVEGVAKSLAKPGGNFTGISWQTLETSGKRLQYLREAIPSVKRVGLFYDPNDPGATLEAGALHKAASVLKLELTDFPFRNADEFNAILGAAQREKPQALAVIHCPLTVHLRSRIAVFADQARIPFVNEGPDFAEAGALLTYGPNVIDVFKRLAIYMHKILQGAKPAELPIEQPTVFKFVVNLKAAKSLGIKLPDSIMLQADEVIR